MADTRRLIELDKAHVWHPFTPMKQWRDPPEGTLGEPLVIERAEGEFLIDTEGRRYIDGVSSLWCNVHGHRVPAIDQAIRDQLDKVAHTTLLGLASEPSIELAAELVRRAPVFEGRKLNKVFYSDAGATAVEVALKMAVGYWFHKGQPKKTKFIAFRGAYHGDTTGSMSVGFSELFHKPFGSMVFEVLWAPSPDAVRDPGTLGMNAPGLWPSEDSAIASRLNARCLQDLDLLLLRHAEETAAILIEPVMQGAAGMICQPPGFLRGVADLARKYNVLLIADEVATGFGRTGQMFACEHESVTPDIMCVAKGITGGYLPLAATLATDEIEQAFAGELHERRTLYHGHTYTGNALGCAAALASLRLFDEERLLEAIRWAAEEIHLYLGALRDAAKFPHVIDVRQQGLMVGIELAKNRQSREPFDFSKRLGAAVCAAMRPKGLIIRPLGDVIVLMPIPAMGEESLHRMLDIVIETLAEWRGNV
jgi:adenosylmethionine---8-amino-7-oxononanoate aminotransferase